MRYKISTAMLILGIAFMVAPIFGDANKEKKMDKKPRHPCSELTAEQMKSIKKLEIQSKKNTIPLHADLQVKHMELNELLAGGADEIKIDAKIAEISNIGAKLLKEKVNTHLGIRKLLTNEQREPFDMRGLRGKMGCCGDKGQCQMKGKFMKRCMDKDSDMKCDMDRDEEMDE